MGKFALFILLAVLCLNQVYARLQCISVRGRVECPFDRALTSPVLVRLADEDAAGPDDPMDEGYVTSTGAFEVYGCAADPLGTTIDPILELYHKCKGSKKKTVLIVPQDFVGKEYTYPKPINLADHFEDEQDYEYHVLKCSPLATTRRPRHLFFYF